MMEYNSSVWSSS